MKNLKNIYVNTFFTYNEAKKLEGVFKGTIAEFVNLDRLKDSIPEKIESIKKDFDEDYEFIEGIANKLRNVKGKDLGDILSLAEVERLEEDKAITDCHFSINNEHENLYPAVVKYLKKMVESKDEEIEILENALLKIHKFEKEV